MSIDIRELRQRFGSRLQENIRMAGYTTARVGGPVDALLMANSADELAADAQTLWDCGVPFVVLGSASNVLVSDAGLHSVVILNRARAVTFNAAANPPTVRAESGANLGLLARLAVLENLAGLEWAATIPGSLGGAVYGNAGAHGGDMAGNLLMAEILHPKLGRQEWTCEQMGYAYRSSALKRGAVPAVILAATLRLQPGARDEIQARMDANTAQRRRTQPPGASMGSMFKNPPGDYAGRLIEAAGLKGARIGGAEISSVHANFFVNHEDATAQDLYALIETARRAVLEQFGVQLELEIELLGDWQAV